MFSKAEQDLHYKMDKYTSDDKKYNQILQIGSL